MISFLKTAIAVVLFWPGVSRGQMNHLLVPLAPAEASAEPRRVPATNPAPAYLLGAEAFLAELGKELSGSLKLNGELNLALAQPWKPLRLAAQDFAVTVVETPSSGLSGTFLIRARITSGGETISDLQVSLRAQLWQEVWTAASRLERGQSLDRSLLSTTRVDTFRERQPPLLAEIDPSNLEVAQTVNASRPLTRRDVIERPLVRRGQVVEVIAQHGQLAISMKALALESGASGELIKLRNLESRKEFSGQILHENKVQVHF